MPRRENAWLGLLLYVALLVVFNRMTFFVETRSFGWLLFLVATVAVGWFCGLWPALASSALLTIYAWLAFRYPGFSGNHPRPDQTAGAVFGAAFFYGLCAVFSGVMRIQLRARQAAEAELWASEELQRLIVDSSIDAIIGISEEGAITGWNPNAEKLLGWSRQEALGARMGERVVSSPGGEPIQSVMQRFFESGKEPVLRRQVEVIVRTKSGQEVPIELYISDHRTDKGQIYILFVRDISERKRAEAAIQELNSRLEERVAERTKQLEAANEELLGFTYSVSHDLRAPLRAIVSNSRIVCEEAKEALEAKTFDRLRRLEKNALKMAELIDNLLQYARIGQVELNAREFDLSAMAVGIAEDLQARGDGTVTVEPGIIVRGDSELMRMVLFNVMENAWKYVQPDQAPTLEVGRTPDGAVFVRDHGIGFDMQYVDKIWEPFERLHRDSDYPGTGIGLAKSRRIVERHGGKIWAESALGQGTTMYFHLATRTPSLEASGASGMLS